MTSQFSKSRAQKRQRSTDVFCVQVLHNHPMSVQNVSQCTKPHFTAGTATSQLVFREIRHARNSFCSFVLLMLRKTHLGKYDTCIAVNLKKSQMDRNAPSG
jgi:hypothetical protein